MDGCSPGENVEVHATVEVSGTRMLSSAVYRPDADGLVDLATAPSVGGSFTGVDPFGLLWSGTPRGSTDRPPLAPIAIELSALGESVRFERLWLTPGATATTVRTAGVRGMYFRPAGDGPFPAVVAFGGSGGGLGPAASWAPVLASRGFAVLAIAYFAYPGLPESLVRIDVECVERARLWLNARPEVRDAPVGVMGQSRGSELALLAASAFDGIGAVVLFSGSAIGWSALTAQGPVDEPAWLLGREPVSYVAPKPDIQPGAELTHMFLAHLADDAAVERALIPVERIDAPVLAVSGEDDAMWPSATLIELGASRMSNLTHLRYPGSGHTAPGPPGVPVFTETIHPLTRERYLFGGTASGCAAARADSWPKVVQFLRDALA